jgi:hypothetical protein
MDTRVVADVAGWLGVVLLLLAYGLVSVRRLEGDSTVYQLLNVAGSALLIANSFYNRAFPSVAVNLFWIGIGVFALTRATLRKAGRSHDPSAL